MKIIIAVIGLAFFIQTICVFETLGEADTKFVNCSEYNSTSCCSIAGCKLYNCSGPAGCENGTDLCSNETILNQEGWCAGTSDTQNTTANTSTTSTQATTTTTVNETTTGTATTGQTTNGSITTEPGTTTNLTVSTAGSPTTAGALTTTTAKLTPTTGTMATATPTTGSTSGVPSNPAAGDESGRHFDAASFIGGIVLCLGLGVIAFIGLKYYRSRSQQNYRTL